MDKYKNKAQCECGNSTYFLISKISDLNRPPILFIDIPENYLRSQMKFQVECLCCGEKFDCIEVEKEILNKSQILSIYDADRLKTDKLYLQSVIELEFLHHTIE